jgi:hypothetical protein
MLESLEEVRLLHNHTNYARWHSRLCRALKRRDNRFWPTLLGTKKQAMVSKLPIPDDDLVLYLFGDDALSVRCQICQFLVAISVNPSGRLGHRRLLLT